MSIWDSRELVLPAGDQEALPSSPQPSAGQAETASESQGELNDWLPAIERALTLGERFLAHFGMAQGGAPAQAETVIDGVSEVIPERWDGMETISLAPAPVATSASVATSAPAATPALDMDALIERVVGAAEPYADMRVGDLIGLYKQNPKAVRGMVDEWLAKAATDA